MPAKLYKLRLTRLVPPLIQGRLGGVRVRKGSTDPHFSSMKGKRKKTYLFGSSPDTGEVRRGMRVGVREYDTRFSPSPISSFAPPSRKATEGQDKATEDTASPSFAPPSLKAMVDAVKIRRAMPNPSYSMRGIKSHMRQSSQYHIGFTLIETLIAVALLLAVLVGPITLIARSLFSTSFSRNSLIANHLAQEGIELVRAVRDNNIICAVRGGAMEWDDNPNGPPPQLLDYYELDATQSVGLICGADIISTPKPIKRNLATCNTPLLIDIDGVYNYVVGTPAGFTRCVRVCSPPHAAPCSAVADADIPNNDQMEIISTVSWIERGASRSVTLRDRLYRWQ